MLTYSSSSTFNYVYFCYKTVNLTVILNFIVVKMTINCDYDSEVGVILPVENKILLIVHLILKLKKCTHFFTLFDKNTAAMFLLVVKMAALQLILFSIGVFCNTSSH